MSSSVEARTRGGVHRSNAQEAASEWLGVEMAEGFPKRLIFQMGDVFDPEAPVARFVAGLGMILNDLVLANKNAVDAWKADGDEPSWRGNYFFRLSAAHAREAVKFLYKAQAEREVATFLDGMDGEVQKARAEIAKHAEPWDTSWVKTMLTPIRNAFFHYPAWDEPSLKTALEDTKDVESDIIFEGPAIAHSRARFADELSVQLQLGHASDDLEGNIIRLRDLTMALVDFAGHVVGEYLALCKEAGKATWTH